MTVPVPLPLRDTFKTGAPCVMLKAAVTVSLELSVTTQEGLLLQLPPIQPAKDEPLAAVAVSVTEVPEGKLALQVCPQLMPEGVLATLPLPVPLKPTVRVGEVLKLAVTEVVCVSVKVQTPVPLHPPDHPEKKKFAAGEAVSVTLVPLAKLAEQA